MDKYVKVLKEVLEKIKPKKEEEKRLKSLAQRVLKVADEEAKKYNAKAMLAGSITRDTWLPEKMEFDVFILFSPSLKEKELEKFGLEVGKNVIEKMKGEYTIEYAQHPYVSGKIKGISVDVVPCYEVESPEKIKSAVDRTPFHVKFIEKNLTKAMADEVRLLKKFCEANEIYGADAKTEGFSGYVCELLIIKYKNFLNLMKKAVNWKPGEIIQVKNYYSKDDYPKLIKKFKDQALILIDPTDKNRNTCAALSSQNFFKFKKMAREFLENPREDVFFKRKIEPLTENELIVYQMKRRTELILIKFNPPKVVPDVLWPQLRRFSERLESILEEVKYEFKVLRKDVYTNEKDLAVVLLEMEVSKLPMVQKRTGPRIFNLDDSSSFLEKYKNQAINGPFIENNFWCVEVRRKFLTAREKIFDSLNRSLDVLKAKGIPNHIAEQLVKGFELILENEKIMELVKKDENFGVFLRKYFEKESLI
ncbi:MAG: CCA tRNA nucleotidyltransferase [Candidatus Aenigmatarchaeota archaeon]